MRLSIPRNYFDNPTPPVLYLCNTNRKRMGELQAYDISLNAKWNSWSELSFSIDRYQTDLLTGVTSVDPLFDKAEGLRIVEAQGIGRFIIQDPETNYGDKDSKTLSCFSLEHAASAKYISNFYVNNGTEESVEVTYYVNHYGGRSDAINTQYVPASGDFDPHQRYYIREYNDTWQHYDYVPTQVLDAHDYQTHFPGGINEEAPLYTTQYQRVCFYDERIPELSLLHLVFANIPEWKIGYVAPSLKNQERKFEQDRISVYDFIMTEITSTFKCVAVWDSLSMTVSFYEEENDGLTDDGVVNQAWDTDIYISRENLAQEVNVTYSTENIKTKLKVSGNEDLDIREINIGQNYIMNLDYYHNADWMEPEVIEAYDAYLLAVNGDPNGATEDARKGYAQLYSEAVQHRLQANTKWSELMHAIPADRHIVLIGDKFTKLYCIKTPIDNAFTDAIISDELIDETVDVLYTNSTLQLPIDKTLLTDNETFVVQGYMFSYQLSEDNFKCIRNITTTTALNGSTATDNVPAINGLIPLLTLYHINEDTKGNNADNILLMLKNEQSDMVTIRIYNAGTKTTPEYKIKANVVRASNGVSADIGEYTMLEWITGQLTASRMGLEDYSVSSIGTIGAYLVLAKDETVEENIQDYGVELLRSKQKVELLLLTTGRIYVLQ